MTTIDLVQGPAIYPDFAHLLVLAFRFYMVYCVDQPLYNILPHSRKNSEVPDNLSTIRVLEDFSQCRTTDAPRTQWCLEPVEELSDLQFTAEIDDLLTPMAQDHCKWNLFLISFLFASVCYLFIGLSYICYTSRANVEVSTLNLSLDFVWGWRPRQDVLWKVRWIALYKSTKSIGVICQMSNVTRYHILQNMSTGSASIWSGRNLGRVYAKEPSGRQCHGESWEPWGR